MIRLQKASNPSKLWYMWFCPGANHAPHHAPEDFIAKYKGMFDDGYDAYTKWVLPRMIAKGVIPRATARALSVFPAPMPSASYRRRSRQLPFEREGATDMADRDMIQRSNLPIPQQPHMGLTTYEAGDPDAKLPPIRGLRPHPWARLPSLSF